MTAWDLLGLRPGADAREIRRAYARLLKQTRPEDDADGFQALHAAYEHCLAAARAAEAMDDASGSRAPGLGPHDEALAASDDGQPMPAPGARDAAHAEPFEPADASPPFVVEEFLAHLVQAARNLSPDAFADWLARHPDLFGVDIKDSLAETAIDVLADLPLETPRATLAAAARFFRIEDMGPRGWHLQERIDQAVVQQQFRSTLRGGASLPRPNGTERALDAAIDAELFAPATTWRTLLLLAWPGTVSQAWSRLLDLDQYSRGAAWDAMPAGRRDRLQQLADRSRLSLPRLVLTLWRGTFWCGLALLGNLVFTLEAAEPILTFLGLGIGASLAWQAMVAGYRKLSDAAQARDRMAWLHHGFILLQVSIALGLVAWSPGEVALGPYALLASAYAYAVGRARARWGVLAGIPMFIASLVATVRDLLPVFLPAGLDGILLLTVFILARDAVLAHRAEVPIMVLRHDAGPKLVWLAMALLALGVAIFWPAA